MWISQNLLIIGEIRLIQIAEKRLLWISQIWLITSVKISWFNSEKYFSIHESVKINWFNSWQYPFHWWISENLTDSDLEGREIYGKGKFSWSVRVDHNFIFRVPRRPAWQPRLGRPEPRSSTYARGLPALPLAETKRQKKNSKKNQKIEQIYNSLLW